MKIAIAGGGASGAIVAIHLQRRLGSRATITIFDPANELGSGLAYSTDHQVHLLNVPAEKMSAFEDQPLDFRQWLEAHQPEALKGKHYPFVARMHFRKYIQSRLPGNLEWRKEKVESARREGEWWNIHGERFDHFIQATGYNQSRMSEAWPKNQNAVAIAGSGLTAIDHWRRLRHDGYTGEVHFVSPRALFPLSHPTQANAVSDLDLDFSSPRKLLRGLRKQKGLRAWPDLADFLRPKAAAIWSEWTPLQRGQFRRHVRRYWEVIRHRLPATIDSELRRELTLGRAFIHRGRISTDAGWRDFLPSEIIDARGAGLANEIGGDQQGRFRIGPASKEQHWEVTAIPEIRRQAAAIAEEIALNTALC